MEVLIVCAHLPQRSCKNWDLLLGCKSWKDFPDAKISPSTQAGLEDAPDIGPAMSSRSWMKLEVPSPASECPGAHHAKDWGAKDGAVWAGFGSNQECSDIRFRAGPASAHKVVSTPGNT